MFCPNCGKETPDHSTFCSHCGYKLDAQMPSGQEEPKIPPFSENNQMPDHRKQGTKKIFVLIGAGIACDRGHCGSCYIFCGGGR